MSIAEKLRGSLKYEMGCSVDFISIALTGDRANCKGLCTYCRKEWVEKLADAIEAELKASKPAQLPEGIEWPRYEDGELVEFGDEVGKGDIWMEHPVDLVAFYDDGGFELVGDGNSIAYRKGEPVKRPEPEVLDADGAPIKVGDTVWWTKGGNAKTVKRIVDGFVETEDSIVRLFPEQLTHRKPDTQEAIDEDCWLDAKDYCEKHNVKTEWPKHYGKAKCEHLLARQRKLLGGE